MEGGESQTLPPGHGMEDRDKTTHSHSYSPRAKGKISPQRYADVFKLWKEGWPGAPSLGGKSNCAVVTLTNPPSQVWGSQCHQGRKKQGRSAFPMLDSRN